MQREIRFLSPKSSPLSKKGGSVELQLKAIGHNKGWANTEDSVINFTWVRI